MDDDVSLVEEVDNEDLPQGEAADDAVANIITNDVVPHNELLVDELPPPIEGEYMDAIQNLGDVAPDGEIMNDPDDDPHEPNERIGVGVPDNHNENIIIGPNDEDGDINAQPNDDGGERTVSWVDVSEDNIITIRGDKRDQKESTRLLNVF